MRERLAGTSAPISLAGGSKDIDLQRQAGLRRGVMSGAWRRSKDRRRTVAKSRSKDVERLAGALEKTKAKRNPPNPRGGTPPSQYRFKPGQSGNPAGLSAA